MGAFASWLDSTFYVLDNGVFNFMHSISGGFLTFLSNAISLIGYEGISFLLLGIILMFFKKTRMAGVCVFGSVGLGAILSNLVIKGLVARQRPYAVNDTYKEFWEAVGSVKTGKYSFPSGHVTGISSAMFALFIMLNKKTSWLYLLFIPVMCFARVYLIAHYTSDVLGAIVIGAISAIVAALITKLIYVIFEKHKDNKFCDFVLNRDLFKKG